MSGQMVLASQFNRPTKMVRVMTLAPLAKIFRPYQDITPYLDRPELALCEEEEHRKEPFDVVIEGSTASRTFKSGEIHLIDESEALVYVGVANNRFNKEYDSTGLVYFDVPDDLTAALDYHLKTKRKIDADIEERLKAYLDKFRSLSHQRVIAHCKKLYNHLVQSRGTMKEAGKAPPEPNEMELLIAFILRDEIKKTKARRSKLAAAFEGAEGDIGEDVNNLL
jgi:hypothetical protein